MFNLLPQQVLARVSEFVFPAITPMFCSDKIYSGLDQLILTNFHDIHYRNGLKNVHKELMSYIYIPIFNNDEAEDFNASSYILARIDGMPALTKVDNDDWEYDHELNLWWWEQ